MYNNETVLICMGKQRKYIIRSRNCIGMERNPNVPGNGRKKSRILRKINMSCNFLPIHYV